MGLLRAGGRWQTPIQASAHNAKNVGRPVTKPWYTMAWRKEAQWFTHTRFSRAKNANTFRPKKDIVFRDVGSVRAGIATSVGVGPTLLAKPARLACALCGANACPGGGCAEVRFVGAEWSTGTSPVVPGLDGNNPHNPVRDSVSPSAQRCGL